MACEAEAGVASRQHTSIKAQMLDRFAVTADQFQGLDADGDVALDEVLGPVIDRERRAVLERELALLVAAGGDQDARAEERSDLLAPHAIEVAGDAERTVQESQPTRGRGGIHGPERGHRGVCARDDHRFPRFHAGEEAGEVRLGVVDVDRVCMTNLV